MTVGDYCVDWKVAKATSWTLLGFNTDARHVMHVLMGLSLFFIFLGSLILRGHLHEVVGSAEESSNSTALYADNFYSKFYQAAVAFTLIVSLPTILDMFLSACYLQSKDELKQPMEIARRNIFSIIFIPNIFIYFNILPPALIDLVMFYQFLLVFFVLIYRIHSLSMSQQKDKIIHAYPLRDLFLNCIATMTMGFLYKISTHGFISGRFIWKFFYTVFLLLFQLLTCLKLKPWFNFTLQLSKVVKNDILLQNKIAFFAVMTGIVTCTCMTIFDAITFNYQYIYFPKSSDSFIAVEWIFCVLLVLWTSIRNFEVLQSHITTANQLAYNRKMTRSISHEIRTPLNTAFMALDLLISSLNQQERDLSQVFKIGNNQENCKQELESSTNHLLEIAESIKEGCDIALNILNQLLTFEKLSAGMLQLENKTVTINQLLDSNMKLFKMQAQQCGITFKLDRTNVDMNELRVYVDEHKMNQVIRNLLSNAMKFTPRGGVVEVKLQWVHPEERQEVVTKLIPVFKPSQESSKSSILSSDSLKLEGKKFRKSLQQLTGFVAPIKPEEAPKKQIDANITISKNVPLHQKMSGYSGNGSLFISIIDSGPGVSAEDQKKLFQEYVQINPGELQKGQGTGLGLSISKSIVHLHGGNIGMTSEGIGKGSTFYIELPCYDLIKNANDDMLAGLYDTVRGRRLSKRSSSSQLGLANGIPTNKSDNNQSQSKPVKNGCDIEQGNDIQTIDFQSIGYASRIWNRIYDFVSYISNRQTHSQIAPISDQVEEDSERGYGDIAITDSSAIAKSHRELLVREESTLEGTVIGASQSASRANSDIETPSRTTLVNNKSNKLRKGLSFAPQSYHILIVDDSIPNRKILNRLLEREGHTVTEAADGMEAVELVYESMQAKFERPKFDLILTDYYMPQMNGPQAIKMMRDQLGYRGTIVGVSGVMDDDVNHFIDAGANLVLCKPLTLVALWKALRSSNLLDE